MSRRKKVKNGQKLNKNLSAGIWNELIDLLDWFEKNRDKLIAGTATPPSIGPRAGTVQGVNADPVKDFLTFSVVGLDDILYTPTDNLQEFTSNNYYFKLVAPAISKHKTKFGIIQEPLANKSTRLGTVVVSGLSIAKIYIQDTSHQFATISDGDPTQLISSASEGVPILWVEPGGGMNLWAIVLMDRQPAPVLRWGVTTSQPQNIPINVINRQNGDGASKPQIEIIQMPASISSGTFILSFDGTIFTAPLAYNASASDVQTALNALSNAPPSGVTVALAGAPIGSWYVGPPYSTGSAYYTITWQDPAFATYGLMTANGTFPLYPNLSPGSSNAPVYWVQWGKVTFNTYLNSSYFYSQANNNIGIAGDMVPGIVDTSGVVDRSGSTFNPDSPLAYDQAASEIGDLPEGAIVLCAKVDGLWQIGFSPTWIYTRQVFSLANNWYPYGGASATNVSTGNAMYAGTATKYFGSGSGYGYDVQSLTVSGVNDPTFQVMRRGDYLVTVDISLQPTAPTGTGAGVFAVPSTSPVISLPVLSQWPVHVLLYRRNKTTYTGSPPFMESYFLASGTMTWFGAGAASSGHYPQGSGISIRLQTATSLSFNVGDLLTLSISNSSPLVPGSNGWTIFSIPGTWGNLISFTRLGQPQQTQDEFRPDTGTGITP